VGINWAEKRTHSWGGTGQRRKKRFGIGLMGFSVRLRSKEFPSDGAGRPKFDVLLWAE
jgi:hypothetical protein